MQYLNALVLFFLIIVSSVLFLVLGTTALAVLAVIGGILFLTGRFKVKKYSSYKKDNVIDVEYEVIEEAPLKKKPKKKSKP